MNVEMTNTNINKYNNNKLWYYDKGYNYTKYIGKKAYICSKWDYDNNKYFNPFNYGKIIDIDELYVCFQRNSNNKIERYIYYTHEEIKIIFLKIYNKPIRKQYYSIKNHTDFTNDEKKFLIKEFISDNFISI